MRTGFYHSCFLFIGFFVSVSFFRFVEYIDICKKREICKYFIVELTRLQILFA